MTENLRVFLGLLIWAGISYCVSGECGILQMVPFMCHIDFQCCT